jgi:hypothetical protein
MYFSSSSFGVEVIDAYVRHASDPGSRLPKLTRGDVIVGYDRY